MITIRLAQDGNSVTGYGYDGQKLNRKAVLCLVKQSLKEWYEGHNYAPSIHIIAEYNADKADVAYFTVEVKKMSYHMLIANKCKADADYLKLSDILKEYNKLVDGQKVVSSEHSKLMLNKRINSLVSKTLAEYPNLAPITGQEYYSFAYEVEYELNGLALGYYEVQSMPEATTLDGSRSQN